MAIGSPVANDFFEPHMSTTMRSSTDIRARPPSHQVMESMAASSTQHRASRPRIVQSVTPAQAPSAVALSTEESTMRIIEVLSTVRTSRGRARNQVPTQGWRHCPIIKGRSSLRSTELIDPAEAPSTCRKSSTNSGVRKIPAILETVAEVTAAATFPRAMDTIVTEDWMVEGSSARYRKPRANAGPRKGATRWPRAKPRSGKMR